MIPAEKYAVDYTDGNGLKWTKTISELYPSLGAIDNSIAISKYNADIMRKVYRKPDSFNPLYDNAVTIGGLPGSATDVIKYFQRSDYPVSDVNINAIILNASTADGGAYATGVNDDANNVINRASMGSYRMLRDVEYNKLLFNVRVREMSFTTHSNVIQKDLYEDPTYTDINLKDIDDNKYYSIFYHLNGKVWDGTSWVDSPVNPAYICIGNDNQTIQGAGSVFNNTFTTYSAAPLGTGQNIDLLTSTSNYYWSGENFNSKMNNVRYCLGLSENITLKGAWTNAPDVVYTSIKQWLIDNGTAPNVRINFEICRELNPIGEDSAVLLTQSMSAYLDNDNNLVIWGSTMHTFFMVKGRTISKMIAGFGLYYLSDENADLTGITPDTLHNSSDIWLGEMSADGTTSGNWIKGADIENYAGYNKDGNINNPNFDPSGGGGGDADDVEKDMTTVTASGNAGMVTYYEINKQGTATATQIGDAISRFDITAIGKDLIRNLISYKAFAVLPVVNHLLNIIHLSGRDLKDDDNNDLWGDTVLSLGKISLGTVKVNAMYGDYRDYAPYTKIEMYIPFCGWFSLPSWVIGKTLSGDMWVDLYNGTVKAIVKASSTVVAEVGGCCAYDIPFVAESTGTKAGAVISSALATAGMTAATIATPNIATATAAISSAANLASALNANTTTLKGCLGDGSNVNGLNKIWVKITRPSRLDGKKEIPDTYKHEYGIPCGKQLTLTAGDGFTQIMDANITGAMTDREKQMIIDGFRHGLIL